MANLELPTGRIDWLDGWRTVAVALVIQQHIALSSGFVSVVQGKLGVYIFFAISGFIVTRLLVREQARDGGVNIPAFYLRRALRILPPLAIYLLVCLALGQASFGSLVRSALFTCNIAHGPGACGNAYQHTWSLAFEEQFYLIAPCFLATRFRWVALAALPFMVLAFAFPINFIGRIGFIQIYMLLGLGATYAVYEKQLAPWIARVPVVVSIIALMASAYWMNLPPSKWKAVAGPLVPIAIVMATLSMPLASPKIRAFLSSAPMRRIGLYSYSLYLWQGLATMSAPWNDAKTMLLTVPAAVLVAAISYHTVERYFREIGIAHSPRRVSTQGSRFDPA